MRRPVPPAAYSILVLLMLAFLPTGILAQEPAISPHEALVIWVGHWDYTLGQGAGTMDFQEEGEFLVSGKEVTPTNGHVLHMVGYDSDGEYFYWHRYFANGAADRARGWFKDEVWTWIFDGAPTSTRRMTMTMDSPSSFDFKWERSLEGGPWTVMSQGRTTKGN